MQHLEQVRGFWEAIAPSVTADAPTAKTGVTAPSRKEE